MNKKTITINKIDNANLSNLLGSLLFATFGISLFITLYFVTETLWVNDDTLYFVICFLVAIFSIALPNILIHLLGKKCPPTLTYNPNTKKLKYHCHIFEFKTFTSKTKGLSFKPINGGYLFLYEDGLRITSSMFFVKNEDVPFIKAILSDWL